MPGGAVVWTLDPMVFPEHCDHSPQRLPNASRVEWSGRATIICTER